MAIAAGTQLGRYEIRSKLGAGGMGEVYLAADPQLRRQVALKILPADLATNQDRMHRFVQEAQAAAALNHPNIAHIYEISEADGVHFIAMEYVEGESLRQRMSRGQLDLREVLDIAMQTAAALSTAHSAGVTHRDIKPENIMRRRDGYVKVLDFGLAKLAVEAETTAANTEAETQLLIKTEPGQVMGTIDYMSPEQARAQEVDTRTDIFSFGVVLYEMVAGRRPFTGETKSDVMAAILRAEPEPLAKLSPPIPAELNRIVRKALQKDREDRYQTVKDQLIDLKSLQKDLALHETAEPPSRESAPAVTADETPVQPDTAKQNEAISTISGLFINEVKSHPRRATVTLAVIAVALAAAGIGLYQLIKLARRPDSFQTMRLAKLTSSGDVSGSAAAVVSPDGKYVVYATENGSEKSLWMRHVATSSNVQIVPPSESTYTGLTFSRDGSYLYYSTQEGQQPHQLYQVPVLGGPPRKLIEDAQGPITFSPDGSRFVFRRGPDSPLLMTANADGTGVQTLATLSSRETWLAPAWSPDGAIIMAGIFSRDDNQCRLVEVAVKDGTVKPLAAEPWLYLYAMNWLPDGSGLVLSSRDTETKRSQIWLLSYPEGKARRVTNDLSSYLGVSLTTDGKTFASVQGARVTSLWIAPAGDDNLAHKITFETGKDEGLSGLAWTADGRIVYTARGVGTTDIWIADRDGGNSKQLTFNARANFFPSVPSNDRYIFFVSDRSGSNNVWRIDLDGSNPKQLTNIPGMTGRPVSSQDGNWVFYLVKSETNTTIWKTTIDGSAPTQLTNENSSRAAVSPDGKVIACVFAQPSPSTPFKVAMLPVEGGSPARLLDLPNVIKAGFFQWAADGRALVYRDSRNRVDNLWSQPLDGGPAKQLTDFKSDQIFGFAWSPDGKVLAVARGRDGSDAVLISNFR